MFTGRRSTPPSGKEKKDVDFSKCKNFYCFTSFFEPDLKCEFLGYDRKYSIVEEITSLKCLNVQLMSKPDGGDGFYERMTMVILRAECKRLGVPVSKTKRLSKKELVDLVEGEKCQARSDEVLGQLLQDPKNTSSACLPKIYSV